MNKTKNSMKLAALSLLSIATLMAVSSNGTCAEETKPPGFRTDLGINITVGANSCIGGGKGYATCNGTDHAWDTGFAIGGGLQVRPFRLVSFGLDGGFANMRSHQQTENKWNDVYMGPLVRLHIPISVTRFLLEPNLGLQVGWLKSTLHHRKFQTRDVEWDWKHNGGFFSFILGVNFFPVPKFAIGVELRLVRSLYSEVCFETDTQKVCRGVNDTGVIDDSEFAIGNLTGEQGIASYPWKLFWGLHGLYYF